MFTRLNLIMACSMVATGVFGWWFIPAAVGAGIVGDYLGRQVEGDDEE